MNHLAEGLIYSAAKRISKRCTAPQYYYGCNRFFASVATVEKSKVPAGDGDRLVVNDANGNPILVAKVGNQFYAIENNCPHMNKSFEKGKIMTEGSPSSSLSGDPEIRCAFHNSRFSLKTGACTKWVTGALGFDNKLIGGVAQKVGGERRDVKAYRVNENEDGSLTIDDDVM